MHSWRVCDCDTWPVRLQTYGYLLCRRTLPLKAELDYGRLHAELTGLNVYSNYGIVVSGVRTSHERS